MKLEIPYKSVTTLDEAFEKISNALVTMKFDGVTIKPDSVKKTFHVDGSGFEGKVLCQESKLEISLDLSFFVRPFESEIKKRVTDEFSKIV